jgi:tripartite-type tricarboxylate transporter receptor subunit TctC
MLATLVRNTRRSALAVLVASVVPPLAAQSAWPDRPVRIIVPSSPGASGDSVARLIGDRLSRALGQSVVIDNRGGGGGNIGTRMVAEAKGDGYTLLVTGNNHPMNVSLFSNPGYKLDDFVPIVELTRGPSVFVAALNAPFDSLQGLIDKARAAPGTIAYGSPGIGLPSHIAFELFQRHVGIALAHAPYKGSGPSLTDAVSGQIAVVSSTLAAALPHIKAGKLRALAVTSEQRWPSLPDTPTVTEATGKPFSHLTWLGMLAPKGTPPSVVDRLNAEVDKTLADPALRAQIETMGTLPVGGSSAAFHKAIEAEAVTSRNLIQSAGLRAE